ncbi:hypothetical protein CspeluHIS016_0108480 [Cutaneotrichosporon spelunceum]|uniref:MFS general substrate transporter n=1 Tax=Cutaneotrichosporon spelunceum TaxID=1672016 RepID=A0AAD3Y9X2_9TREE|nr:hypothetical protein CspeluHIS016_0108480 [Cutaneotrichosporon spelunceum]
MSDPNNLPIPGSLLLVDENASGARRGDIILSPKPSRDVNDPLNWSKGRKQLAFAMLMTYTVLSGFAACSVYSVLVPLGETKDISLGALNAGTGYMFLLLGWGGLITQPLALTFGKRPLFIFSTIGHLGTVIWQVYITSEGTWHANKVLQGLFTAPIEMLIEVSIADLFFAHERGFYMGLYATALYGGNFLAPVWAGFANDTLGWEWVFWLSAIMLGVLIVVLFLFMEETNYNRGTTELEEKHSSSDPGLEVSDDKDEGVTVTVEDSHPVFEGTEYSYWHKIALYRQRYTTWRTFWAQVYRPIIFFRYPVVLWSGLLYGSSLVWYNVLNATASMILTEKYNFSASMVGLFYLGPTVGACLSSAHSGWAADKWLMRYTRKRGGVREPEDRLWLLTVNAILLPVGLILWGVGAANHIHWFGLVVGGALVAFTSASGGAFALNYVMDSYKDLGGEVVLTTILIRNSLSFAIGYGITPWLNMGLQNTFITAAMVGMALYGSFVIMTKWGRRFRKHSRKSYWNYVASSVMPNH